MEMNLRKMTKPDIDFAVASAKRENWISENRYVYEGFLKDKQSGCFIAEENGNPAGMCVAIHYGKYGFFGELMVNPEMRGKGLGGRLLKYSIDWLKNKGAKYIYLDAVPPALSLYEQTGFKKICRVYRLKGNIKKKIYQNVRPMKSSDLYSACKLDKIIFGADRQHYLQHHFDGYVNNCLVMEKEGKIVGYLFARPVYNQMRVGPWCAEKNVDNPEYLLTSLAEITDNPCISMSILENNDRAIETVQKLGMQKQPNPNWRMVLGSSDRLGNTEESLAVGSPAKG